ncbi:MAG: hypothetical protein JO179_00690 [Solirubrobacterales bacterium]|nr:hypothetical protein [Solirubrobacterales bacterium]
MSRGLPVWLALEPDPVLALVDAPPQEVARATAVLICPPFGWEEMCSYRPRRLWAVELARSGFPTARINFPATGDSGGYPDGPDRLEGWIASVEAAAAWLRERFAAERVAAIGIGLGGLVACRAASAGAPIDDLVLWSVPARGRMLVRELRAHAGVIDAEHLRDREVDGAAPEGALEAVGFVLSAETVTALEGLDLTKLELPRAAARRILLLGRDRLGPDKRLQAHLEQAGADVSVEGGGDYTELTAHPQAAAVPWQTINATVQWLKPGASPPGAGGARDKAGLERDSIELRCGEARVRETPLWLDLGDQPGFAILTEPVDAERATIGALLLSAGALREIGPNRAWVEMARRWAARGVATVRVDLAGIGESDGEAEHYQEVAGLYEPRLTGQVLNVIDDLAVRELGERFVLAGLCSGSYWALHAALADPRVAGLALINLFAFYWSEALVAERRTHDALSALRGEGWRKLARRDTNLDQVRRVLASLNPQRIRARRAHPVESAQSAQIDADLDRLRDQQTELLLLLSEAEPLYGQFERQHRIGKVDRWPNLTIERYGSRDHMFRALWLQRHIGERVDSVLERVLAKQPTLRP